MADRKQKARDKVRRAQAEFERAQSQRDKISTARRRSFEEARKAGLTLREIGEAADLHLTRVKEIIEGD
jgi:hypothetical protein